MSIQLHNPDPALEAVDWITRHSDQYLHTDQLIAACALHLVTKLTVPMQRATELARHALGELHSRHRPAYIDMARSTSYVLYVVDPRTGRTRYFTAAQLLDLVDGGPCAMQQPTGRSPAERCGTRADTA